MIKYVLPGTACVTTRLALNSNFYLLHVVVGSFNFDTRVLHLCYRHKIFTLMGYYRS